MRVNVALENQQISVSHAVPLKGRVTLRMRRSFCLFWMVALIMTGPEDTSGNDDGGWSTGVCNTSGCFQAANQLRLGMNRSANPCDDFYEFACGNFFKQSRDQGLAYNSRMIEMRTKENAIVKKIAMRPPDSFLFQPAKSAAIFFHQCINEGQVHAHDNMKAIVALTTKLGGWPSLAGENWNQQSFDFGTTLAFVLRETFYSIFMKVKLAPHGVNKTVNVIKLDVPTLTSEDKLNNPTFLTTFKSLYLRIICDIVGHPLHCHYRSFWANQDADEIIQLEKNLKQAAVQEDDGHSSITNKQIFSVAEFQEYLDKFLNSSNNSNNRISWKRLLNKIFGTCLAKIKDDQVLIVAMPGYFVRMVQILGETPARTIANFVLWRLVQNLAEASGKLHQLAKEVSSQTMWPFNLKSREHYCLEGTMRHFSVPIMHEYLKTKPNLADRAAVEQMTVDSRATFDKILESNSWLSDAAKLAMRRKLRALKTFIGYPSWLLNATEIESRFEGLHMGSNFVDTLLNVFKWSRAQQLRELGKCPRGFDEPWFHIKKDVASLIISGSNDLILPSDVEPLHLDRSNSIVIPMGFIQPDLFQSNLPSVIYSSLGFAIGHEIAHGLHVSRTNMDENGQIDKSWTAEDELKYKEQSNCYSDQYNKFEVFPGMNLNGSYGLNENIADNVGLKLAYMKYKEQHAGGGDDTESLPGFYTFSAEQMFFLSFGSLLCEHSNEATRRHLFENDPHSPGKYRVNGVLQNSQEFAKAWNCPLGVPMNPVSKCSLW